LVAVHPPEKQASERGIMNKKQVARELVRVAKRLVSGVYSLGTFGKPVKYQRRVERMLEKEVPNAFTPNVRYVKGSLKFTKIWQNPMLSGSEHGFTFEMDGLDDDGSVIERFGGTGKVQAGLDGREAFIGVVVDV